MTNIVENDSGSRRIKVKTFVSVDINSKKQKWLEHVKSGKNQYLQERRRAGAGHRIELP